MTLTTKQKREFGENQRWLELASKCEHTWQEYQGIPSPLLTCKLTNDACSFENCPKRKKRVD